MASHPVSSPPTPHGAYAALRRGGAPPSRARSQLDLSNAAGSRLEAVFRLRAASGAGDVQLPKFARHEAHVARVMAEGGFPAFTELRRGKGGAYVRLPLIRPTPAPLSRVRP